MVHYFQCRDMKSVQPLLAVIFFMTYFSAWDPAAGGGGGKKHEIYVTTFGGHLFYDLFLQGLEGGGGGPWPPRHPPLDPLLFYRVGWGEGGGPLGLPSGSATVEMYPFDFRSVKRYFEYSDAHFTPTL